MQKALQTFGSEYLRQCQKMSPQQILQFLDDFSQLHYGQSRHKKSKLISMKVLPDLLRIFRQKTELEGIKYQTKIKQLMEDYVKSLD